jgi:hypothetical protein
MCHKFSSYSIDISYLWSEFRKSSFPLNKRAQNWNLLQVTRKVKNKIWILERHVYVLSFRSESDSSALPRWLKIMKSRFAGSETILQAW